MSDQPILFGFFCLLVLGAAAIYLAAPAFMYPERNLALIFRIGDGYHPSLNQRAIAVAIYLLLLVLCGSFWWLVGKIDADHKAYLENERTNAVPTIQSDAPNPKQSAIDHFEALGFEKVRGFEGLDGEQLEVFALQPQPDANNLWRRTGAIVYPNGESAQFSIAILYSEDSWQLGNETKIQRQRFGRAIKIETALNRPLIRDQVAINDYVLGIGLASSKPAEDNDKNNRLAVARGYNIGYGVLKLEWKPEDRIRGISLGHAVKTPIRPELEPYQRAAIIIGVNASRDIVVRDLLIGSSNIITLEGVDLGAYSISLDSPTITRDLDPESGYLLESNIVFSSGAYQALVLPAVRDSIDESKHPKE